MSSGQDVFEAIIARGIEDRSERMQAIQDAIDAGHVPDRRMAERLADYILLEELTDDHPDKMSREEYPILSYSQMERRHAREVPLKVAEEVGIDGRNYRIPNRRKRGRHENMLVDKYARGRNQRRRRAYNAFVAGKDTYKYEGREVPIAFIKKAEAIR